MSKRKPARTIKARSASKIRSKAAGIVLDSDYGFRLPDVAYGDRPAWLGMYYSNSEMSSQNIPLKDCTDFR
jgi:hypothetical protein